MMGHPKTKAEAETYHYGAWGGCPKGRTYKSECCAYEVFPTERGMLHHQCAKKPGHGPAGLYCAQHAKQFAPPPAPKPVAPPPPPARTNTELIMDAAAQFRSMGAGIEVITLSDLRRALASIPAPLAPRDKDAIRTQAEHFKAQAEAASEAARRARWANNEGDAQYQDGLRVGYLNSANDLLRLLM